MMESVGDYKVVLCVSPADFISKYFLHVVRTFLQNPCKLFENQKPFQGPLTLKLTQKQ